MKKLNVFFLIVIALGSPVLTAGEGSQDRITEPDRFPVKSVTLYTAGLAWMMHETTVTGHEILSFEVEQNDINDILKSLVVEDLDGGTVDSINFESENPLAVALADMRVNPSGSPALVDFLKRTQGESVTVSSGDETVNGRIFSVETVQNQEGRQVILNLMNVSGIEPVDITEISGLKFDDTVLQDELLSALDLISRSRVKTSRVLKISFRGEGTRTVRLSYIRAVPLWKTSYRVNLDDEGIPALEGWALVQNTGSVDWKDVQLSFVAGQPNAFTMDLATPRYVQRQQVQTAAAAPLGPTEYDRGYAPPRAASESYKSAAPSAAYGAMMDSEDELAFAEEAYSPAPVEAQATGFSAGNFYRYTVNQPVTVYSRSSAMIPIISLEGAGETLALYDPSYDIVFKGIRLINGSGAHWAAGPVTVSEGRYYGGDALLPEMIPGSERLLTYAVHGSVQVDKIQEKDPQRLESLVMVDGLLKRTDKIRRVTEYRISGEEKELLIIHRKERGWDLVENPEIAEETASEYRFVLNNWEKPAVVVEEYIVSQQYSLANLRLADINYYIQWDGISPAMKQAFSEIASLLSHLESVRNELSSLNSRISRLERDQNRVRENMKVLDTDSDLYTRYADQLDEQESEIRQINNEINRKQQDLSDGDKKLKDYISGLDLN
ncbi:hypothetical protein [Spirochaeta isovalerica]|uniref:DUF4139 domain-containing protein n=1 Tax=Spirochaeta isovalerica TaxID=150 RepID=A0A841R7A7_9SPIO|nr:hypothetical protein [Spirochaeta isovalerica]MBB6479725.1 hypothetical protein [Spirochaeta isovalerica]